MKENKTWKKTELHKCSECGELTQREGICFECIEDMENSYSYNLRQRVNEFRKR